METKNRGVRGIFKLGIATAWLFAFVFVFSSTTQAATPQTLPFQGKVVNANGTNVTDGTYSFTFKLYDESSVQKWGETQASVQVTSGIFQVNLGATCGLFAGGTCSGFSNTVLDFSAQTYSLGIAFNGDSEMTPRITLGAVPYALNADKVGGLSVSQLIQLSPGSPQSGNLSLTGTATLQGANALTLGSTTNAGAILLKDGTVNNRTVTLNVTGVTASYALTLPTTGPSTSQCLQSGAVTASQLAFGSCDGTISMQKTYNDSGTTNPQIALTGTNGGLKIQDAASTVGNILAVSSSGGGTTYLAVTNAGISVTGIANASTKVTTPSLDTATAGTLSIGTATATTVVIGSNAVAANSIDIDAGSTGSIDIGNTTSAHTINIGSAGAAAGNAQNINIGSPTTTTNSEVNIQAGNISTTSGASGVTIGNPTTDANLVPFQLDSFSTFTDPASTCTTTVNQGAMFYNTSTAGIRACINGAWEDVASTAALSLLAFGVVPDSGATGSADLPSAAGGQGPCKVYQANSSTTSVSWNNCVAYTGGRKVVVAAATNQNVTNFGNNGWVHLCLNASSGSSTPSATPTFSTNGNETANLPAFSVSSPIVCLADISTSNSAITGIYDTRTFTTTDKEFASTTTAFGLGMAAITSATAGLVAKPATTTTGTNIGIVVATAGSTTGTPNLIIANDGPVYAKSAGTTTAGNTVINSATTAGYVQASTASTASTTIYGNLGFARTTRNATCTSSASASAQCQLSVYFNLSIR